MESAVETAVRGTHTRIARRNVWSRHSAAETLTSGAAAVVRAHHAERTRDAPQPHGEGVAEDVQADKLAEIYKHFQ